MKLLLDTHVFLWLMDDPQRLSPRALAACENVDNRLCLSVASVWEMQIKQQLGKLQLSTSLDEMILDQTTINALELWSIDLTHVLEIRALPLHHHDPFDRLLIAQARAADATLVSADNQFKHYEVDLLW